MRITPEAAIEVQHLLVQHGVVGDRLLETIALLLVRQLAVQEQVADLHEGAFLG